MRVYVAESSILLTDGQLPDLKVPSGEQTGIKVRIDPDILVDTLISSEILLDFDVSKSFELNGNTNEPDKIKGFKFKPVVRGVNYSSTGTIAGTVSDHKQAVLEHMEVWIRSDTIITTAFTNDKGIYGMLSIPEGSYSMYATGEGYDTAVYELVEVFEGDRIIKNFTLNPL